MNIIIKELTKTCIACPTQFEGITIDNKDVYMRYRNGTMRIDIDDETILRIPHGNYLDGFCSLEDFIVIARNNNINIEVQINEK